MVADVVYRRHWTGVKPNLSTLVSLTWMIQSLTRFLIVYYLEGPSWFTCPDDLLDIQCFAEPSAFYEAFYSK